MIYINLVAVLAAAVSAAVLGFLWYSPVVFGKKWAELSGISQADLEASKKGGLGKVYGLNFLATVVMAYVLAHVVYFAQADTMIGGAFVGFWSWLGFVATTTLGNVLFERKPWKLWILKNGYNLLSLMLMGAILAVL